MHRHPQRAPDGSACCDHAGRQHRREPPLHVIPFPPSKPAARATRLVARDMHGPRCWDNNDRLQRRPQDIAYVSRRTMDRRGLPRDDHRPRQRRGCALQPRQASAYGADLQQRGDRCNWPCQRNQVHHPDRCSFRGRVSPRGWNRRGHARWVNATLFLIGFSDGCLYSFDKASRGSLSQDWAHYSARRAAAAGGRIGLGLVVLSRSGRTSSR